MRGAIAEGEPKYWSLQMLLPGERRGFPRRYRRAKVGICARAEKRDFAGHILEYQWSIFLGLGSGILGRMHVSFPLPRK